MTTLNTAVGTRIGYNYDALKRLRSRAVYQGSTPLFENRYAYATQSGNQSTALVEFFNYRLASDDGNGDIIVGYQYEYDDGGNITDIKAEVDGALIPLEHYEYDEKQGQLKTAIRYENGEEADRWTYSYDTAGNILSEDHEGSNSELHEYAYEDGRWGDLLTSVDGIDLEYDGSGNPTLYANGTELLWSMEWQNGRQLSRATTERDSTTEDVLDFAYDANGIRTRKTVTRNTYRPVQTYKVTFVADGKTVKTMNVTEGYTLKDSDYPAVPEKAGYTGAWQRYPSPVKSNVTVSATYTKITTYYTVTFVADGFTVKTMQVYSGYKLKDSDYPSVPEKLRYEGTWQKYTAAITSNVTVQATYRKMLPLLVRFYADETLVKTMQVDYGYRLNDLDYPDVPPKTGFTGSWRKYTQRITSDQIIRANYMPIGIIDPVLPSTVDSEPTEEPWEPIEPNAAPAEEPVAAEPGLSESDWTLASTETVTHEYLTQNGKVARETIRQDVGGTVLSTKTLDFFYDDSGRPFAFNYSVDGGIASTYYYILNLQGDVVQIIDANGVMQAEYVYSPWGEIISAEGDLAEINPLRYRGYYYDSETGFYYLQSRYYDPENHRFINADTESSTGQGFIGTNAFVYVLNNPVALADSGGDKADITIWSHRKTKYTENYIITMTAEMVIETPMFDKMTAKVSKDSLTVTALGKKLQGDYLSANFSIDATMSDDRLAVMASCSVGSKHFSVGLSGDGLTFSGKLPLTEDSYLKLKVGVIPKPQGKDQKLREAAGYIAQPVFGFILPIGLGIDGAQQPGIIDSSGGMDDFVRPRRTCLIY